MFNVGPLIFARVYFSSCIPAVNLQRRFHLSGERILRRLSSKFYTSNRHSRLLIHTFGDWFRQRTLKNEDSFFFSFSFFFFIKSERRGSSVAAALRHCLSSWSSAEYFTEPHFAPGLPRPPPLRRGRGAIINCTLLHPQIPVSPLTLLPPLPSSSLPLNSRHAASSSSSFFSPSQPVGFQRLSLAPPSLPPSYWSDW